MKVQWQVRFSLQICAGATGVIWPNEKLVAWTIFGFGSAILVISLVWWFRANYEFRAPLVKRDAAGAHQDTDRFPSPTISRAPSTLKASLYVCDIRFTFADLKKNRHSEVTMRVFNGSGRVVQFVTLSGKIKFNAPNSSDPDKMGELPTPALRPDTARTHFDLSGLNIQVAASDKPSETERLPVWSGVSYKQDYGFGRIISASLHENLGISSDLSD
jgi:hypothetical protein